jgi:hypothetical protein
MPTPRRELTRAVREYVPLRVLAETAVGLAAGRSAGAVIVPEPDSTPGLAERLARFAEDARPRSCAFCEGPDAYGRPHDPACPLTM